MSVIFPARNATHVYGLPPRWRVSLPFAQRVESQWPGLSKTTSLVQLKHEPGFNESTVLQQDRFHNNNLRFFGDVDPAVLEHVLDGCKYDSVLTTKGREQTPQEKQLISAVRTNLRTILRHPIGSPYDPNNITVQVFANENVLIPIYGDTERVRAVGSLGGLASALVQHCACGHGGNDVRFYSTVTHEFCHCAESLKIYVKAGTWVGTSRSLDVVSGANLCFYLKTRVYHAFTGLQEALADMLALATRIRIHGVHTRQNRYSFLSSYIDEEDDISYAPHVALLYALCDEVAKAGDEKTSDVLVRAFRLYAAGDLSFYDELLELLGNKGFRALASVVHNDKSIEKFVKAFPRFSRVRDAKNPTKFRSLMTNKIVPSLQEICRQSDEVVGQRDRSMSR